MAPDQLFMVFDVESIGIQAIVAAGIAHLFGFW